MKIIFYAINGMGLGHVVRTLNIAKSLKQIIDCEILFVTNTPFKKIFVKEGFAYASVGANPIDMVNGKISENDYVKINENFLYSNVKLFQPDIIIFDLVIMPKVVEYSRQNNIFSIYILRQTLHSDYLANFKYLFPSFNLTLIPHAESDVRAFFKKIIKSFGLNKDNIFFVNNLFRQPNKEKIQKILTKYKKQEKEFLITVISGGGGYKDTEKFFESIGTLAQRVNLYFNKKNINYSDLVSFNKIRWLLIKGPLFWGDLSGLNKEIETVDYELDLPELFAISNLIISRGGYNSVNEIIASRVPVLFSPTNEPVVDSQIERIKDYNGRGFMQILNPNNFQEALSLFKNIFNRNTLIKMKLSYNNYIIKNGNKLAASIIVNEFYKNLRKHTKIGFVRFYIDTIGEHFIYEETQRLVTYKPVYFCGKIENINQRLDYFCNRNFQKFLSNKWPLIPESLRPIYENEIQQLQQIILQDNIKILHFQFATDALFFSKLLQLFSGPIVVTVRGYDIFNREVTRTLATIYSFVSKFIAKSNSIKKELISRGCPSSKIEVIYGGIDVDKIIFKKRIISKDNLKIISAGRFTAKKGFDVTIKSFIELLKNCPNAILTLIGEGELKEEIVDRINKAGIRHKVKIKKTMGHEMFIKELYKHDIFILPSKTTRDGDREGIPNVLKEAMAAGMPVISTYHSGIPELIRDGETGFLVEENDYVGIVNKIKYILNNKNKLFDICLNARFFIEKKFNIRNTVKEIESIYHYLLTKNYIKTIVNVIEDKKPIRFRADLHLISGCNSKCIMCDNWKNNIKSKLSRRKISELLDNLKLFGVNYVRFHGQEPTLHKNLFAIMKEAKQKGFRVGIKTNVLNFNTKKLNLLSCIVDDIYLSIDSVSKDIHNRLRGNNISFKKNIEFARAIKSINSDIKLYINSVITNLNFKNLDRMVDLAYVLKADKISFVNLNTNNKEDINVLRLNADQFIEFYFEVYPKILEKSVRFNITTNVDPYFHKLINLPLEQQILKLRTNQDDFKDEILNFAKGEYGRIFYKHNICYGVLDHITIDWEGNVFPCCAMKRSQELAVGNILEKKFSEIWKDKRYIDYRQEILKGKCKFKNLCARNFTETTMINEHFRKYTNNVTEKVLEHYIYQYKYVEHNAKNKLYRMVHYAYTKSDFYREKLKNRMNRNEGFLLSRLPIVKRDEMKAVFPKTEIVPNYFEEDYAIYRTSSCGPNAFLYARPLALNTFHRMATSFLNTEKWKVGQPWLKLTALNCLETAYPIAKFLSSKQNYLKNIEKDVIIIPPSDNFLKEPRSKIKEIFKLIKNSKTQLIHTNPTYLKLLLYRFRKEGLHLSDIYAVHSTYEILLPSTRKLIKQYLNCEVYDQYGCSEIGPISFACKYGNYHIFGDSVYVEVVPAEDLGRKDIGRAVVTDLENRVMPFIRYFTGDFVYIVNRKECKCDFSTPLMGIIAGREDEIINYKGKIVFPLELDSVFSDLDNILMYQVIFETEKFFIKVVPIEKLKKFDKDAIRNRLIRFFGDNKCLVKITLAESILPGRRGKYKTVVVK